MKILYISVFLFLYVLHTNADENETNLSTKVGKVPDIKKDSLVYDGDSPIPYTTLNPFLPDNNKTSVVPPSNGTSPPIPTTPNPPPTTVPTTTITPSTRAPNITTAAPNTTTLAPNTTTLAPNTTTLAPNSTTLAPTTTTLAPNTTTTPTSNTTTVVPNTTTPVTPVKPTQRFDFPSFIGGMMLTLGLMAIAFVAHKFYKARTDRNYHTL